ncbi:MAG: hypothetical protein KJ717_01960, partial [Proteobacteria bacterium]|nr:hypothetical protein [Pseudomonadota bacterium]
EAFRVAGLEVKAGHMSAVDFANDIVGYKTLLGRGLNQFSQVQKEFQKVFGKNKKAMDVLAKGVEEIPSVVFSA